MRPEPHSLSRRGAIAGALTLAASLCARPALAADWDDRMRAIEAEAGGRLGLWAAEVGGDTLVGWRETERFLMCSTFKALAVAALLARVDHGHEQLARRIAYGPADLQDYAPVTKANVAQGGMALDALCAAAIEVSDNTAANLILAQLGGPAGVTAYVRSLGDSVTRLDRTEPSLNDPGPAGDLHDSTTPASMAGLWRQIVLGEALSPASRAQLVGWLKACKTGPHRLMSITPAGWGIAHKTGSGRTTIGDVAVLFPPGQRRPIQITAYFEAHGALAPAQDAAIARAGRAALNQLAPETAHG